MRIIGFIGAYDKMDLIIYISKILTAMNKKVLIVDATILQKTRYIVPALKPAKAYITNFEEIDIAVGFTNFDNIKIGLGMPVHATFDYDYIFLDIDTQQMLINFNVQTAIKNYFVTGFDLYSLKRGLEILSVITEPIPLTKILFSKNITKEEDEYLHHLTLGHKAIWNEENIYFPFEQGDQTVIIENQRVEKIKFKKLTQLYKESLCYIVEELLDNPSESTQIRKVFKLLEKGT